ncbi:MAG: zinc dependent phospholipase C family protein [Chloroflexi bacterium]|nr:zinc dependent phospholipase C family protein [Chloroflexota bacterium]
MPNLPAHIDLAQEAAKRLGHPTLEAHMGCFLFGSTSPDIRVITRRKREEYHFTHLDFESVGAGIEGLFKSHPRLLTSSDHDGPTQAFICGYITHLLVDESWIVGMFRQYFGNSDVFEDDVLGKVLDRALQLELDRQCDEMANNIQRLQEIAINGIKIGFIPSETLTEWRDWVVTSLGREFSWERLKFMAHRISNGDEAHPAHALAEEFVQGAPQSLEDVYDFIPRSSLSDYREQTIDALVRRVGDYLR